MNVNIVKERFLKYNKQIGLFAGLWPGQNSYQKILRRIIIMVIMLLGYAAQAARLVVYCSVNTFLTDAPFLIVSLGTIIKTSNCIINESKLKVLLNSISEDWLALKSKAEFEIMLKYGKKGFFIAKLYMMHIAICTALFSTMPFIPPLLDIILPLNKSREPMYPYPVYYSSDNEKYYLVIVAHMSAILFFTTVLYCACDMNYVYIVQHACGLLAIAGHRFKCAYSDQYARDTEEHDEMGMRRVYRNVCDSIRAHQHALSYVNQIQSAHNIYLFILMGMVLISISLSLLMVTSSEFGMIWFIYNVFLLTQLIHIFFLVVQGQFVINAEDVLYETIWEATWYNATNETKALYLLALRRSLTPPMLTAGGFVKLDLKTFTEVIKASVSYYTVMKSK